ncbi:hypothetical protein EBR43_06200, partial [bacterium]|nr:hypothetical protein [bacterium]
MGKPVDRDKEYMYKMWGTTSLITDYNSNLLREVTTERYLKNKEFEQEKQYEDDIIEKHKTKLLSMARFSNLVKEKEENIPK